MTAAADPTAGAPRPSGPPTATDTPRGALGRVYRRWRGVPLLARLVAIITVLLLAGVTAAAVTTTTVLRANLVAQVDAELTASARDLGQRTVDQLTGPERGTSVLPSQFYVRVQVDGLGSQEFVSNTTAANAGTPRTDELQLTGADAPITVPGEGSAPWRAVTMPLTDSDGGPDIGTVTVALPLAGVEQTMAATTRLIVLTAVVIVVVGALAAWFAVRRSLRPLREIEETAGAIAAGDLSRRVPSLPLSTEVGSLAGSLNTMLSQIERAFAAQAAKEAQMRRFVSDASHELRTPLSAIRGYGELYRMGGVPEEQVPHALGRIESEAKRMGSLVEDLLQLARLDEGRPLSLGDVDLVEVAEDAAADARAQAPDREIAVVGLSEPATSSTEHGASSTEVAESAPIATRSATARESGRHSVGQGVKPTVIRADGDRIRQVVANLVGNVLRHTPDGTPLELAVGPLEQGWALLEVRDHGSGIPEEEAARVFERFYRADPSRARASGGSGLGLAIVASVIGAHGGAVRVVATPGGGATVQVALRPGGPPGDSPLAPPPTPEP